jgi:diguanylate cyclase (GGDEF)-like protein
MSPVRATQMVRARLRWRREEIVASLEATDPAVVARSLAYLFAIGGLLVLLLPALPGRQLQHPAMTVGAAVIALVTSAAVIAGYDGTARWVLSALPSFGTLLVTFVIVGLVPSAAPAGVFLYFWVILTGFYFYGLRTGLVHLAGVAVGFAAALLIAQVPQGLILWLMAMSTLAVTGVLLHLLRQRADTLILTLDTAAHTDSLTGLANRRSFEARFEEEIYRAGRTRQPLTLMLVDVDGFKSINDNHGHPAGDAALKRVAGALSTNRRSDRCARVGGDEFAVLLPDTDPSGAGEVAERLLDTIRRDDKQGVAVRVSLGLAAFPGAGSSAEELHHAADVALYEAKRLGGDRSVDAAQAPRRCRSD